MMPSDREEVAEFFREGLDPLLIPFGFHFDSQRLQYRRKSEGGNTNITLSLAGSGIYTIELHLGARHDLTENLIGQITFNTADFSPYSNTISTSMAKLINHPFARYSLSDYTTADQALDELKNFLQTHGLPFLDDTSKPDRIHALLNHNPASANPYVFNQTYRCFRGLAIARYVQSGRVTELYKAYKEQLVELGTNEILGQKFDALYNHLRSVSLN
ncbi:hypothetical protein AB9P05_20690 [Roseivirga sp. BDSF3-8]|uniref:hypothetical protein n=1 Tax=Roseivirga sp. BDSF3-8 TaxID=3241598 RepID=UPI0035318479